MVRGRQNNVSQQSGAKRGKSRTSTLREVQRAPPSPAQPAASSRPTTAKRRPIPWPSATVSSASSVCAPTLLDQDSEAEMGQSNPHKRRRSVYVLGHSFIKRLGYHARRYSPDGSLNLNDNYAVQPKLLGWSGATVNRLRTNISHLSLRSSSVIIQIGGNDLNSEAVQPVQLARQIINLGRDLVNEQGVHSVTICKLLYRTQAIFSRFLLRSNYNNLVDNVNSEIDLLCSFFPKLNVWCHVRIINNWSKLLVQDGTHLNELGTKRYFRSIRGATMRIIMSE